MKQRWQETKQESMQQNYQGTTQQLNKKSSKKVAKNVCKEGSNEINKHGSMKCKNVTILVSVQETYHLTRQESTHKEVHRKV